MPARLGNRWLMRRASVSEGKLLVDHRHRMWEDVGGRTPKQLTAHDPVYRRWILPRVRTGEVIVLVIESPGRGVVASGGIWFRPEQPRPGAPESTVPYLFSMYTEPEFRGRGLARRIVREALRLSRRRGYARVLLHAAPLGRPVYRSLGFERSWEMRRPLRK
ncbi:MAG: GNAT family N-acetyltransferase [Thermoplasmata archaeon]|nr:GNAT family N-acetyltransferase [Thermoplasmata archaeon]